MAKFTKKSGGSWPKLPFKLGEDGSIYQPSTFGDSHGKGEASFAPSLKEGIGSGKRYKKGKK